MKGPHMEIHQRKRAAGFLAGDDESIAVAHD